MEPRKELPKRKKNRAENYDYSSCGVYFITICTLERQNYFWQNAALANATIGHPPTVALSTYGEIVNEAINSIPSIYPALSVKDFVIMPNHVHILLQICSDASGRPMVAPTVSQVINHLKGAVSKQLGTPIWQKSFYDHIVRNTADYEECVRYIRENPICWYYDELYTKE